MNMKNIMNKIYEFENSFKKFMDIDKFPQYIMKTKEASEFMAELRGYDSVACTHYDIQKNAHTLTISTNVSLCEYLLFHEFTHMIDSEYYVKRDNMRYIGLSGFTEYHASQIELMSLLNVKSINDKPSFCMDSVIYTISGNKSVKQYIEEKQQHAMELFGRSDFPSSIETLKSSLGVLFNYWGLRSICDMYANDYIELVKNQEFLKYIPTIMFTALNRLMHGWLDENKIEESIKLYKNIFIMLVIQYKLK